MTDTQTPAPIILADRPAPGAPGWTVYLPLIELVEELGGQVTQKSWDGAPFVSTNSKLGTSAITVRGPFRLADLEARVRFAERDELVHTEEGPDRIWNPHMGTTVLIYSTLDDAPADPDYPDKPNPNAFSLAEYRKRADAHKAPPLAD